MTWSDPTTRSNGDLITAAIWNQDVVDNGQFLHDRTLILTGVFLPNTGFGKGDYASRTGQSDFSFPRIPDDFDSLVSAYVVGIATSSGTMTYDIGSDYGSADAGEDYNLNSESSTGQTLNITNNDLELINVAGVLTGIAAGDSVGINFDQTTGADVEVIGAYIVINRS